MGDCGCGGTTAKTYWHIAEDGTETQKASEIGARAEVLRSGGDWESRPVPAKV